MEDASASWGEPKPAAYCGDCHGTQTIDSNRVCDCLLSVRVTILWIHMRQHTDVF